MYYISWDMSQLTDTISKTDFYFNMSKTKIYYFTCISMDKHFKSFSFRRIQLRQKLVDKKTTNGFGIRHSSCISYDT